MRKYTGEGLPIPDKFTHETKLVCEGLEQPRVLADKIGWVEDWNKRNKIGRVHKKK